MSIEYIRYELTQHTAEELVSAYDAAAVHLRAAPECLSFEMARCVEAPASFILRIRWTSTEAHLQGFRKGPHFPPFLQLIRPFVPEIAEMRHYEETDVVWERSQ